MGRTLEIEMSVREYTFEIRQFKGVDMSEVENIDIEELQDIEGIEFVGDGQFFSQRCLPCYIHSIVIKNDDIIESKIEYDESIDIQDVFNFKFRQTLYWGEENKEDLSRRFFILDEDSMTCIRYDMLKAGYLFTLDNFQGEFDMNLITVVLNNNKNANYPLLDYCEEFVTGIFYGERIMDIEPSDSDGKACGNIYHDKGWNKKTPVLYIKEPEIG